MRQFIFFMLISLAIVTNTRASYISMETSFSVTDSDKGVFLKLRTQNKGDEPAYAVQFEASVGKAQVTGQTIPQLSVNEETSSDFHITDAFTLPGHYPVIIRTHYQDANSYPFSSITVGFYDYQTPAISDIFIKAKGIDIPGNSRRRLDFTLRNSGNTRQTLELELNVPKELAVNDEIKKIDIGPKTEKTVTFTVENFSGLENSSYAVFLVARYKDNEKYHSTAGSAIVRIKALSSGLSLSLWLIITIITAVILIAATLLLRRK
ncbi:hypothetical protein [Desulfonema magnum]|nr:hypothetical protein [Desulfonema magnum]